MSLLCSCQVCHHLKGSPCALPGAPLVMSLLVSLRAFVSVLCVHHAFLRVVSICCRSSAECTMAVATRTTPQGNEGRRVEGGLCIYGGCRNPAEC